MNRSTLKATAVATTLVLAAASLTAATVLANDSAIYFGAYGPQPFDVRGDRESPLRMVEEELVFHFGKWRALWPSQIEFMKEDAARFDAQYRHRSPLRNMETRIDGKPVSSSVRLGFVDHADGMASSLFVPVDTTTVMSVRWYVVELVIPPKGRLTLERRYDVDNGPDGLAYGARSVVCTPPCSWKRA